MDRSLYIAMNGAKQTLLAQTSNANNLANTQTSGFKADLEQARAMPVFGPGFPSRVYAMTERPGTDMSAGGLQTTGNELDVAIKGEGWIAIQDPDGGEAYTRGGDLNLTPAGDLLTSSGLSVMGNGGPINIPPANKLQIGNDGTISIVPLGANPTELVVVDRIKLVNPELDQLEKKNDGLMHLKEEGALAADANVSLIQGAVEGSNVNAISAMVDMIELARNFELQTKVMKNADDNAGVSVSLMRMA